MMFVDACENTEDKKLALVKKGEQTEAAEANKRGTFASVMFSPFPGQWGRGDNVVRLLDVKVHTVLHTARSA